MPFALALMAQVGFIVHQVAFLLPLLGVAGAGIAVALTAGAATTGRLMLATVIDRLNQRRIAAISFASQAAGLAILLLWPATPAALYLGSVIFGLSVGNVVTLPALIVQREFAARSFGLVIGLSSMVGQLGLSAGPALLGAMHDATGGYPAAIGLCLGLQLVAALLILRRPAAYKTRPRPVGRTEDFGSILKRTRGTPLTIGGYPALGSCRGLLRRRWSVTRYGLPPGSKHLRAEQQ